MRKVERKKRNIGNYGREMIGKGKGNGREMEGEDKKTVWGRVVREGEGRESMEGWQIKKGRKWEYREGKG